MPILLTSGISIIILALAIGWMFYKLKRITFYNVIIYIFLLLFWTSLAFTRKISNTHIDKNWELPLIMACFQFFQVAFRLPIGWLSRKLKSRKVPLLISTLVITIASASVVLAPNQLWSSILAFSFTGIFGATYGLQNQYWSENYNIKSVFITVALIAILPSLSSLIASFSFNIANIKGIDFRWFILGSAIVLTISQIMFLIFKEKKETIKLDNVSDRNKAIRVLKFKDILIWTSTMLLLTFGFNLVTSGGSSADSISYKTSLETVILTLTAVCVAVVTSLLLVQVIKSYHLILISHLILILGFLFGVFILFFGIKSTALKITYLVIITIGFNLFQYTSVGITLHIDHKNTSLVLSIWLTFRSFATGSGELVGNEIENYFNGQQKWLIFAALIISFVSLGWTIYKYKTNNKVIYKVVDHYEYYVKNSIIK